MGKDEKLLQHVFRLFDPLVRDEWTVNRIDDAANRTTFFFVNGASRVRIDANRIPFTVGGVDVNHGDGFDMLRICAADPDDRKPIVMFRLDQGTLKRKELSFNVI